MRLKCRQVLGPCLWVIPQCGFLFCVMAAPS
jgi:hypothetical protein